MTSSNDPNQNTCHRRELDPFNNIQPLPSGWDLSEIATISPALSEDRNHAHSASDPLEQGMQTERVHNPEISFTEWQLRQHLTYYDSPDSTCFSAF